MGTHISPFNPQENLVLTTDSAATAEVRIDRYNVHPTDALHVVCTADSRACRQHCHWRVVDHLEGDSVAYLYDPDVAEMVAGMLNLAAKLGWGSQL